MLSGALCSLFGTVCSIRRTKCHGWVSYVGIPLLDKSLVFAVAALTVVIAVLAGCIYCLSLTAPVAIQVSSPTSPFEPFDYQLTVSPNSSTVLQGSTIQIYVTATPVQGLAENVTLGAQVPEGADFAFNPQEIFPAGNSTLTIHVSKAVPISSYNITVNAFAENGKNHSIQTVLVVCVSEVTVSGAINIQAGTTPKQVIFEQLTWEGAVV